MEWLFGSTKKTPKPEVYVSNVVEGDFSVVTSSHNPPRPPYPLYPTISGTQEYAIAQYPPYHGYFVQESQPALDSLLYQRPHPYVQQTSSAGPVSKPANPLSKPVNPLDSIPFKLSSPVDSNSMPVNEYQLKSIKSQLDSISNRINSDSFNYSFELERSVLSEANY